MKIEKDDVVLEIGSGGNPKPQSNIMVDRFLDDDAEGGDLSDQLISLAEERGIARKLRVVDAVPREVLLNYYAVMDVFVLPSLTMPNWKEQFGHVLMEVMSAKVPVIGSTSGEIPNVIGDAGLIFPEGNAEALHHCIVKLMNDKVLRSELSERWYRWLLEYYTHERIAQRYVKIYRSLVE